MNVLPLQDILESLESGARPPGGVSADSGEIASLGGEHLNSAGGFDFTSIKRIPREFFESIRGGKIAIRDILIVKDGATTGKTSFVRDNFPFPEAAVNEHVFCVRVDQSKAVPEYVFHFLHSPLGQKAIHLDFRGATVGGISREFVTRVRLVLPSPTEQRRIAEILDKADALRAKRRAALAQLDALTQSIFLDMFGDPATILERWTTKRLGQSLDFLTSGSRGWAEHYAESGDLFLRIQNVGRDELLLDDIAYVNAPDTVEAKRIRVEPGDVLLSITADLGRTAVVPEGLGRSFINQHLSILRTKALVPRFLSAYLSSPVGQRQVSRRNRHGVKAGLNFDDIRSLVVPVPPPQLQHEFANRVTSLEKLKTTYYASLTQLDALFAALQHRAFRGEL